MLNWNVLKINKPLDGLAEGDEVEVSFNVRGNEYNGKYYKSTAWRINKSHANPRLMNKCRPNPILNQLVTMTMIYHFN